MLEGSLACIFVQHHLALELVSGGADFSCELKCGQGPGYQKGSGPVSWGSVAAGNPGVPEAGFGRKSTGNRSENLKPDCWYPGLLNVLVAAQSVSCRSMHLLKKVSTALCGLEGVKPSCEQVCPQNGTRARTLWICNDKRASGSGIFTKSFSKVHLCCDDSDVSSRSNFSFTYMANEGRGAPKFPVAFGMCHPNKVHQNRMLCFRGPGFP